MKLKDLSSLGEIYSGIASNSKPVESIIEQRQEILLTDATQYLPENKQVKPGSALGGGPGAKGDEVHLAKKTGPEGLKGNQFEKISKKQDPGTDKSKMKKEEGKETAETSEDTDKKEDSKENVHEDDAAKNTTPKEKVRESAGENNKYNYKPKFTMSKLKFDQLYEDAIKRIPFTEDADADMGADAGVPPADDVAADADTGDDMGGEETSEVTITLDRETAQKLHDLLMAQLGGGDEAGGQDDMMGGDEPADAGGMENMGEEGGDPPIEEEVEAQDLGHAGVGSGAKSEQLHDKAKMKTVSDLKVVKGTADKGTFKNEPQPKEEKGNNASLQGKSNKVGSGTVATTGKKAFE
jgi:hypothetical protein